MEEEAKNTPQVELINGQVFPENVKEEEFQIPQKNNNLLIYFIFIILILGILGFLGWKYVFGEKIINQFFPTPTPTIQVIVTPTAAVDPTANWKTYKNTDWDIAIKYPEFLELSTIPDDKNATITTFAVRLQLKSTCRFTLGSGNSCIVLDVLASKNGYGNLNLSFSKERTIGSTKFLEVTITDDGTTEQKQFFVNKQGGPYLTFQSRIDNKFKKQYPDLLNQILSTFKFVEKSTDILVTPSATESGKK